MTRTRVARAEHSASRDLVTSHNQLADTVFVDGGSVAGDYVDLTTEMDALPVILNCPQVNNPCNDAYCLV